METRKCTKHSKTAWNTVKPRGLELTEKKKLEKAIILMMKNERKLPKAAKKRWLQQNENGKGRSEKSILVAGIAKGGNSDYETK